jgi:hypothetical protein
MQTAIGISSVGQAIQLAVAPVFLLAGVGALLGVLINRLGRIIDRVYALERELPATASDEHRETYRQATLALSRRARLIHWAISLCTTCELLVCVVVATLFISAEIGRDFSNAIAYLFVGAMLALITGLICFLREIALATALIESLDKTFAAPARK